MLGYTTLGIVGWFGRSLPCSVADTSQRWFAEHWYIGRSSWVPGLRLGMDSIVENGPIAGRRLGRCSTAGRSEVLVVSVVGEGVEESSCGFDQPPARAFVRWDYPFALLPKFERRMGFLAAGQWRWFDMRRRGFSVLRTCRTTLLAFHTTAAIL